MQADRTRFEGPRHIDHALVGAAAPVKLRVLLRFDKRPVHHYVYGSKERQICNLLEAVAGVQPDGLDRKTRPDFLRQRSDLLTVRVE